MTLYASGCYNLGMVDDSPQVVALRRAIQIVGSQSAFARLIGVTQQSVSKGLAAGRVLAADHVRTVEAATGVPRWELRPDLYPPEEYSQSPGARPSEAPAASSPDEAAGVRRPSDPLEGLRS